MYITSYQIKSARTLLGIDQKVLAEEASLSLPTVQRMEACNGQVKGNVDSLVKVVDALSRLGVVLISSGEISQGGGFGVRLTHTDQSG